MKLTKKQLSIIIESYLRSDSMNEGLKAIDDTGYEVPKCNFQFDPQFLEMYEFLKTGKRPSGYKSPDEGKPDMFNPLFINMLTNDLLPFANLMVAPVFGISAKCKAMSRMQELFNKMYREFSSGFEYDAGSSNDIEKDQKNAEAKLEKEESLVYDQFFKRISRHMTNRNLTLAPERMSNLIDIPPAGLAREELIYASHLIGNLGQLNSRAAMKVINSFKNAKRFNRADDLIMIAEIGKSIPGHNSDNIARLIKTSIPFFESEPIAMKNTFEIINKLFDKLKTSKIIQ